MEIDEVETRRQTINLSYEEENPGLLLSSRRCTSALSVHADLSRLN